MQGTSLVNKMLGINCGVLAKKPVWLTFFLLCFHVAMMQTVMCEWEKDQIGELDINLYLFTYQGIRVDIKKKTCLERKVRIKMQHHRVFLFAVYIAKTSRRQT